MSDESRAESKLPKIHNIPLSEIDDFPDHPFVDNGVIGVAYIDADDQSPVPDIKPYAPSLDRVETPQAPEWCGHWPKNVESSGDFDWESEFNF